ncbi:hypothetical protein [Methanobrevibacter arboriphilus]|uniref:hypothetical protein n=1 Tax=Methanobrevibacter arboriphilus TaxID=39441 RepID=UPI0005B2D790|nr:hypothetical protein [Methanobrevibacter arboriphilus]
MLGEPLINITESAGIVPKINYSNVVCIVAPFKDSSFVFKSYKNIQTAITEQKTTDEDAVGYRYLQILSENNNIKDVILCNLTTGENEYDYSLTDEKLANIFEELKDVHFNILAIPYELTPNQLTMYKVFRDNEFKKMNAFGLNTYIEPTLEKIQNISAEFADGGIYKVITTPISKDLYNYSLSESVIYHTAVTAGHNENVSETYFMLDGVSGEITKEKYSEEVYNAIINNGSLAVGYRDKVNGIVQIINSNTPSMNDLKIERVYHLIINEVRRLIEDTIGKDNSRSLTYPGLIGTLISIKNKYVGLGYITDLNYTLNKIGQDKAQLTLKVNEDDIIGKFDVSISLEINEE